MYYNTSLLWKAGEGAVQIYDKMHPVPFAEYMPDRAFWRPFAPDLIDLISRDYTIGTQSNVFDINGMLAGIAICFDIADDQLVHEMIDEQGRDHPRADQQRRLRHDRRERAATRDRPHAGDRGRAHGRQHLDRRHQRHHRARTASTLDSLPTWEPGAMVADVPLSDTVTPAMAAGRGIEWLVSGLGLAGFAVLRRAARRQSGAVHETAGNGRSHAVKRGFGRSVQFERANRHARMLVGHFG